jgi:hypothetical protein
MTRGRLILFRLIGSGLAMLLAIAGLELFVRARPPHNRFLESAIETPRLSAPGEPEFRLPMRDLGKPDGVFRIVAVGDSYTFGDGVYPEDAYPQRLAARFRDLQPISSIEVVTWARRGWNTAQELRSIRPHLDTLSPDLLLIGFTLNDTELPYSDERESARERTLPRLPPGRFARWIQSRSVLFDSLWTSLENIRLRRALAVYYRDLHRAGPGVSECRRALKGFHRFARNRGIPMLVVVFPIFDSQLDHRYRYAGAHQAIVERLAALNIPSIDLLPYYQGLDGRRLAVTPFTDPHPSELAHRIAADAIVHYLVRDGLVPTVSPPTG